MDTEFKMLEFLFGEAAPTAQSAASPRLRNEFFRKKPACM